MLASLHAAFTSRNSIVERAGKRSWHGDVTSAVTAQTFQFRRYPAERARRLTAGPHWDRRSLVDVGGALILIVAGASFWSVQPRAIAIALLVGGLGMLAFAVFA